MALSLLSNSNLRAQILEIILHNEKSVPFTTLDNEKTVFQFVGMNIITFGTPVL